ncbi:MAG TPA: response regulator [Methanocella sp.]|nr:response regulator [Methanocella sp.]
MENSISVAIVDDEPMLVKTYEKLLRRRQIPIAFSAYSGEEAVAKFKEASPRPGIVILDYRMGRMNGLEVMKAILAEEPGTKVIFISGDGDARGLSLASGAMHFLKKPVHIEEIMAAIRTATGE